MTFMHNYKELEVVCRIFVLKFMEPEAEVK